MSVDSEAAVATVQTEDAGGRQRYLYDEWLESQGLPIYRGNSVPDVRTADLGWWSERDVATAFIQLAGQQGISEARVSEIPAAGRMAAYRMAIDEVVYVAQGNGSTLVGTDDSPTTTFEWGTHALFLVPRGHTRSFANLSGNRPVRLLHYSYLPLAMSLIGDTEPFADGSPPNDVDVRSLSSTFGEPQAVRGGSGLKWLRSANTMYWYGNLFPDMSSWSELVSNAGRGARSTILNIQFAGSQMSSHMSEFPARTYKKAHRHGPGRVIVIPGGEGYSVMWLEGSDKVVVPWHEGSLLVPPERWYHQHFNLGSAPARYLAFHPPLQFHGYAEDVRDRKRDQIEYVDEDPWIRERFNQELEKRDLTSLMPRDCYSDPDFKWSPGR